MNQFLQNLERTLAIYLPLSCLTKTASQPGLGLLVALSGGADSTALLLGLSQLAPGANWQIFAAHINHNLRGDESAGDEDFCRSICNHLKIPLDVQHDIVTSTEENTVDLSSSEFSEDSLRERRYSLLIKTAKKFKVQYILTAHTLDDQTETVLFRLFRGTALKGLRGINLVTELDENIHLVRPLLSISKQQCCQFLAEHQTSFRYDSSNKNEKYTRNFLRHKIIPLLQARFSNFSSHIEQLREIIDKEDIWLEQLTRQNINQLQKLTGSADAWSVEEFNHHPIALKRRILAEALRTRALEPSFARIDEIIKKAEIYATQLLNGDKSTGGAISLSALWRIQFANGAMLWLNSQGTKRQNPKPNKMEAGESMEGAFSPINVRIPGNTMVLSQAHLLRIEELPANSLNDVPTNFCGSDKMEALVDLAQAKLPLVLRLRAAGDIIQPLGMSEKVRLKKYLHTHKYSGRGNAVDDPFFRRQQFAYTQHKSNNSVVVLADQEEVIWVPGVGLSEKVKVVTSPSYRLKWLPIAEDNSDIA